mmetsp:Transcript_37736/g.67955  ORF Transcript_37736/g.67955 Transcript_37736/m.67955 type:complete len:235 (-) Transcript_37736:657-1361(-)
MLIQRQLTQQSLPHLPHNLLLTLPLHTNLIMHEHPQLTPPALHRHKSRAGHDRMRIRQAQWNNGNLGLDGHGEYPSFEWHETSVGAACAFGEGHDGYAVLEVGYGLFEGAELGSFCGAVDEDVFSPHQLLPNARKFLQLILGNKLEHRIQHTAQNGNVQKRGVIRHEETGSIIIVLNCRRRLSRLSRRLKSRNIPSYLRITIRPFQIRPTPYLTRIIKLGSIFIKAFNVVPQPL